MIKTNGDKATIREVYDIVSRLENKFDERFEDLDKRISNIEGKASALAIVWSSVIAVIGITVGVFVKK